MSFGNKTQYQSPTRWIFVLDRLPDRSWVSKLMAVCLMAILFTTSGLSAQTQDPYCLHFDDLQIETDGSGELEVYLYHLLPLGAFSLGFEVPEGWQIGEVEPGDAIESLIETSPPYEDLTTPPSPAFAALFKNSVFSKFIFVKTPIETDPPS